MRSDLSLDTQSKPVCTDLSGGFFYFNNSMKADYSPFHFAGTYLLLAVCPTYVVLLSDVKFFGQFILFEALSLRPPTMLAKINKILKHFFLVTSDSSGIL
jgi:hypothetical protein